MTIHRRHGTAKEGKPFTQRVAYRIMTDIAMGMFRLHDLGFPHRDLKATNVLVSSKGTLKNGKIKTNYCPIHDDHLACRVKWRITSPRGLS